MSTDRSIPRSESKARTGSTGPAAAGAESAPNEMGGRSASTMRRGRLKIFFGMAPGVGKTYAMLAAARRLAGAGVDVVAGIVETHGRSETEQLLLGLDILPRRVVRYRGVSAGAPASELFDAAARGVTVEEFDLEAALARRPDILLVDELAHTNIHGETVGAGSSAEKSDDGGGSPPAGVRGNEKRWQDVQECLRAGINVYTTINVQHIESLNDVVAQITGVVVRETVPDWVIDEADEIELVDLPPEDLHERLRAGKVYRGEGAARAVNPDDGFFRKGNLTALRELALRRTAHWVDSEMRRYKADRGIRAIWPAGERILVAVSPSPMSPNLVRAAKRMAAGLWGGHAELLAVYVEPSRAAPLSQAARDRVTETLRLAESLGASTSVISSEHPARDLIAFARSRNVARIVVGKTGVPRWREAFRGTFVGNLVRESGDIDIFVVRGDESGDASSGETGAAATGRTGAGGRGAAGTAARRAAAMDVLVRCVWAVAIVSASTLLAWAFRSPPDLSEEAMILLAGVIAAALTLGRGPAVLTTALSIAAFNFFFVEPRFTFAVQNTGSYTAFAVMLAAGLIIGSLAARTRDQTNIARLRERRTAALYAMSRELAGARDAREVAAVGARHLHDTLACDVVISAPSRRLRAADQEQDTGEGEGGRGASGRTAAADAGRAAGLDPLASAGIPDWFGDHEREAAMWALDHARAAGLGTARLSAAAGRHVPLTGTGGRLGVLSLRPRGAGEELVDTGSLLLLEAAASQIASALERAALIEGQQSARLEAERERLRSALLSSVSHDLRTPLASITGAASTLQQGGEMVDAATRDDLLGAIIDESARLSDLIANLVFATRLEAGDISPAREWTTVEEIVGVGLARHRAELAARPFSVHIAPDLPFINVDNAMLPQVIHNLVENALRYTPAGTAIGVSAWATDTHVVVKVADQGPGLADDEASRVFQRFYRGRASRGSADAPHASRIGMGLGLTICDGVIKVHGGRIWAEPNTPRGVSFLFSLPIEHPQPSLPVDPGEGEPPSEEAAP